MELYDEITPELGQFMRQQAIFFVASAPLAGDGHINLSPKGMDTFRVLEPHKVAYLDLTGSGNETSAHLLENGRITFMFCSFSTAPSILRLYGRGHAVLPSAQEWPDLYAQFDAQPGARQIVVAELERIQTSCGYAVPLMENPRERETLTKWCERKGADGIIEYQRAKNMQSIDGLTTHLSAADPSANQPVRQPHHG